MSANDNHVSRHSPFIARDIPTFADVILAIQADPQLERHRKADLCSSLRRFAEHIGQRLEVMPAAIARYRQHLERLHHAQIGCSEGRVKNIRSHVRYALERYGAPPRRTRTFPPVSDAWLPLLERFPGHDRHALSRFIGWASGQGIAPSQVTDEIVQQFQADLEAEGYVDSPIRHVQTLCHRWNGACDEHPDWPKVRLAVPRVRDDYSLPWSAFPASFQEDAQRWIRRVEAQDPLDPASAPRPLSATTVRRHHVLIRRIASAATRAGTDATALANLADLVRPNVVRTALVWMLDRMGTRESPCVRSCAGLLLAIARHHVRADQSTLAELADIQVRCGNVHRGMTDRNRERLEVILKPENLRRLNALATDAFARAAGKPAITPLEATRLQVALAVEILLFCPIRIGNLAEIAIDFHLSRTGNNEGWRLRFPAKGVKNRTELAFELPPCLARMIATHLSVVRPLLPGSNGPFLFPARNGGPKSPGALGERITKIIHKHAGVEVHPHLFRHLAATRLLADSPGDYESARRLLGHRSADTTHAFYAAAGSAGASRRFSELVLEARAHQRPGPKGGR